MITLHELITMDPRCSIAYISLQNALPETALIRATAQGELSAFNTLVQISQDDISI